MKDSKQLKRAAKGNQSYVTGARTISFRQFCFELAKYRGLLYKDQGSTRLEDAAARWCDRKGIPLPTARG